MKAAFLMLMILALSPFVEARTYKIKKGHHSPSGLRGMFFVKKAMSFSATFKEDTSYDLGNVNQLDTNKLYGFADCWSHHQKNSARFGWRWNTQTQKMEIMAYTYANKVRNMQLVDSVDLNQTLEYRINIDGASYEFVLNGKSVYMPRGCSGKRAVGYKLYPYFGGDEVAPHEMHIKINNHIFN